MEYYQREFFKARSGVPFLKYLFLPIPSMGQGGYQVKTMFKLNALLSVFNWTNSMVLQFRPLMRTNSLWILFFSSPASTNDKISFQNHSLHRVHFSFNGKEGLQLCFPLSSSWSSQKGKSSFLIIATSSYIKSWLWRLLTS